MFVVGHKMQATGGVWGTIKQQQEKESQATWFRMQPCCSEVILVLSHLTMQVSEHRATRLGPRIGMILSSPHQLAAGAGSGD